jgi:hypothetical protein
VTFLIQDERAASWQSEFCKEQAVQQACQHSDECAIEEECVHEQFGSKKSSCNTPSLTFTGQNVE